MKEFKNLEALLAQIGSTVKDQYKKKLKQSNTYASGKLYNSVDYKIEITDTSVKLYFSAENYWINVENGRVAGKKMPPLSFIKKWMTARGIPNDKGNAFLISRSISKNGIKPKPFLRQIQNGLNIYIKQIEEALKADVEQQLNKLNKLNNGNNNII